MPVAHAQDVVAECPGVKVVIDGKITTYSDVPLSVNGSTLLPLRAILANLGVQNDDRHIIWNDTEKSVTIHKDSTKIYLKQDSKTAYVNDSPVTLDAAAMLYAKNGRIYIPARFVAQALGKKVFWDGSAKCVLIRDEKDYNSVKAVLDKVNEAGKAINKMKFTTDIKLDMDAAGTKLTTDISGSGEFDKGRKVMHMNLSAKMLNQDVNYEYYFLNNTVYMKISLMGDKWNKLPFPEGQLDKMFESNYNAAPEANDTLCAGLVIEQGANANELVLKGDVYYDELMKALDSTGGNNSMIQDMEFDRYYLEMTVDKNTNLVTKAYIDITMKVKANGTEQKVSEQVYCSYEYTDRFDIAVPEDLE